MVEPHCPLLLAVTLLLEVLSELWSSEETNQKTNLMMQLVTKNPLPNTFLDESLAQREHCYTLHLRNTADTAAGYTQHTSNKQCMTSYDAKKSLHAH